MTDWGSIGIAAGVACFGLVTSGVGYMSKKVFDLDRRYAAHEASDIATFAAMSKSLDETKEGVTAGNAKLDRLIEHMLDHPSPNRPRRKRQ